MIWTLKRTLGIALLLTLCGEVSDFGLTYFYGYLPSEGTTLYWYTAETNRWFVAQVLAHGYLPAAIIQGLISFVSAALPILALYLVGSLMWAKQRRISRLSLHIALLSFGMFFLLTHVVSGSSWLYLTAGYVTRL
jgi:hypothetical protein